jgi:hypothetical protein
MGRPMTDTGISCIERATAAPYAQWFGGARPRRREVHMAEYVVKERNIQSSGHAINAIMLGFGPFTSMAAKYLLEQNIGTRDANGKFSLDVEQWYPIEGFLSAFRQIAGFVGPNTLYQIGLKIPETALLPEGVTDVYSAIRANNIAYHMNHKKNGKVMYDAATGRIEPGIGDYGFEPVTGQNKIISVCNTPFPCDFDRGITLAYAKMFQPSANVELDATKPQKKKGADSSTYIVTW